MANSPRACRTPALCEGLPQLFEEFLHLGQAMPGRMGNELPWLP